MAIAAVGSVSFQSLFSLSPFLVVDKLLEEEESVVPILLNLISLNQDISNNNSNSYQRLLSSLHRRQRKRPYVRYDELGNFTVLLARSHSLPNAVHQQRSIPQQHAEDWDFHFRQRTNTTKTSYAGRPSRVKDYDWRGHSYSTDYRTLYLANPSVLPLHNTIATSQNDPDWLSLQDLDLLTGGDPTVRYLATFRAYTGGNCFGADPVRRLWKAGENIYYLGIALLDENLNIINNTDVLIDLNAGPGYGRYWQQTAGDCRLNLLRSGIYLLCNDIMFRVNIRRKNTTSANDNTDTKGFATGPETNRLPYLYRNLYGDGLEIVLLFTRHRWAGKHIGGKNWNVFRSPSTSQNSTGVYDYYLQIYPMAPHWYHRLNVPPSEARQFPSVLFKDDADFRMNQPVLPNPPVDTPDVSRSLTKCEDGKDGNNNHHQSKTCREVPFWGDQDRGSACCISMQLPRGEAAAAVNHEQPPPKNNAVLVGITHAKFTKEHPGWSQYGPDQADPNKNRINQYVSRFVAYQPHPPFDIVARSGWFCLGFAAEREAGNSTLAGRNTRYRLDIFDEIYQCPYIHFVTGFAEVVGDASRVIISYGVNDCHPRMIVIDKSEVIERLWG